MNKTIKCKKCGKESPESGVLFDEKSIKEALSAPLDCNGNSIYDFSNLKKSRSRRGNYCYWCGAKLEAEPIPAVNDIEKKNTVAPPPASASKPKKKSPIGCIVVLLILVGLVFFFIKGCGGDKDSQNAESGITYKEGNLHSSDKTLEPSYYSKMWNTIDQEIKDLGSPIDYVNANSKKSSSEINNLASEKSDEIMENASEMYSKITNEAYSNYESIVSENNSIYEKELSKEYDKYMNNEIDYSAYEKKQSEAYSKLQNIQSELYSRYEKIESEANSKYLEIQTNLTNWNSKVQTITNGL